MEREQGMIKGANEVCVLCLLLFLFLWFYQNCNNYPQSPIRAVIGTIDTVYIASGIRFSANLSNSFFSQHYLHMPFSRSSADSRCLNRYTNYNSYSQMLTPGTETEKLAQPTL